MQKSFHPRKIEIMPTQRQQHNQIKFLVNKNPELCLDRGQQLCFPDIFRSMRLNEGSPHTSKEHKQRIFLPATEQFPMGCCLVKNLSDHPCWQGRFGRVEPRAIIAGKMRVRKSRTSRGLEFHEEPLDNNNVAYSALLAQARQFVGSKMLPSYTIQSCMFYGNLPGTNQYVDIYCDSITGTPGTPGSSINGSYLRIDMEGDRSGGRVLRVVFENARALLRSSHRISNSYEEQLQESYPSFPWVYKRRAA
jgi:hypothetical protein